jgi:hypothetical protein
MGSAFSFLQKFERILKDAAAPHKRDGFLFSPAKSPNPAIAG